MVTLAEVAQHAGVSASTVSYVLSGKRSISDDHPGAGRAEHPASSATTRTRARGPWPAAGPTSSR